MYYRPQVPQKNDLFRYVTIHDSFISIEIPVSGDGSKKGAFFIFN